MLRWGRVRAWGVCAACAAAGQDERAFEVWEEGASRGVTMDTVILNSLLHACARTSQARSQSRYRAGVRMRERGTIEVRCVVLMWVVERRGRCRRSSWSRAGVCSGQRIHTNQPLHSFGGHLSFLVELERFTRDSLQMASRPLGKRSCPYIERQACFIWI